VTIVSMSAHSSKWHLNYVDTDMMFRQNARLGTCPLLIENCIRRGTKAYCERTLWLVA
jgi:hypothetical protein